LAQVDLAHVLVLEVVVPAEAEQGSADQDLMDRTEFEAVFQVSQ